MSRVSATGGSERRDTTGISSPQHRPWRLVSRGEPDEGEEGRSRWVLALRPRPPRPWDRDRPSLQIKRERKMSTVASRSEESRQQLTLVVQHLSERVEQCETLFSSRHGFHPVRSGADGQRRLHLALWLLFEVWSRRRRSGLTEPSTPSPPCSSLPSLLYSPSLSPFHSHSTPQHSSPPCRGTVAR